ncbi:TPA: endonuclease I [Vibrio parahaemolyticus]|uniref:endonuclease n=2 Tax=Vibrio parahaemolyticus TaxID=670 RepID=UPI000944C3E1|nr:endonuclease I [Vibrio parahaemolyticus]MBE3803973.1 endonuclease I [Vibrio parahaemolyticus]MBE3808193.1 endonuclease I [Vibrio parahaemolyticus]MBE4230043.1 endonuclease I [Vibrio parahaemolyticus]MBE4435457.1 endonuclease I [Vibrio parahaemolyticus]
MTTRHIFGMSLLVIFSGASVAEPLGNTTITSFNTAKKIMQQHIYTTPELRKTLYCRATFNVKKEVTPPSGFKTNKYKNRLNRWEAEHIVPAENFGHTFIEWREGHPQCINNKGKAFKGRKCAEKVNTEYRLMQSDLYNLYPAIGSVNAARQNYNFTLLPHATSNFGQCDVRIDGRKVQPPEQARGAIARTYLYFEAVYPRYSMSKAQRQLMQAWDKQYPTTKIECQRAQRIKQQQGNTNPILAKHCY